MRAIIAPEPLPLVIGTPNLFLGGGISNCPDWQSEALTILEEKEWKGTVVNPRRPYQINLVSDEANDQIEWEHKALAEVDTVLFWFPCETLCPITLFELGTFIYRPEVRLVVGTHPDYARRFDVIKQLGLARPEINVHDNIPDVLADFIQ